MAEPIVEGPELVVRLSWLEKLAALRGYVRIRVDLDEDSRSPDWSCR